MFPNNSEPSLYGSDPSLYGSEVNDSPVADDESFTMD